MAMTNSRRPSVPGFLILFTVALNAFGAECLTSSDQTACGFHCVSGEGEVRCAQTPDGVCSTASGIIACWDPPSILRRIFGDRLPRATCVTNYGQTACGYGCESNSDRVSCAQTPFGKCVASDGKVACWDPPAAVMLARRLRTPVAQCIASFGRIACGYQCVEH